ncbi:MFS transporter [Thermomonospora amylolytica]|uniref:MFS transporter n=1 Tax=Thermomonospora amylolytica TaxID=1411117 RepID=UPI000E6D033C|nr:MFS transporter [Thermomonospora amylolytica]
MLSVLRHRGYRHLFAAQVIALVGTGLATVALGLLAYDIAGAQAGAVLGTALAIKMVAYVGITPVITALAYRLPRRGLLVGADLVRAAVALALPFVTEVWQVYLLIFLLQCASATFTPAFQAVIPQVLPDEDDYTRALSLSSLAYDLENLFSPVLAAALLAWVTYNWLFLGTVAGFVASAVLVVSAALPKPLTDERTGEAGMMARMTRGVRLFAATPRLRALLALDLAVAAASAMVLVNTIVYVREHLDRTASAVPVALGAYGSGSVIIALLLPRILRRITDRAVMLPAACAIAVLFTLLAVGTRVDPGGWAWPALLAVWAIFGAVCSLVITPTGRLIRRSAAPADLTAAFAAQFSLSHGCWLLTYPLAGWLGAVIGLSNTAFVFGALALGAALLARQLWPVADPVRLDHVHTELEHGHPHLAGARRTATGWRHAHHYVIDDLHARRPVRTTVDTA